MTDEALGKKAEEIANKRCHEIMCWGHCSFSSPKHHRCGEWHREYNCALAGLKAGFEECAKARLNVTTISDYPIRDDLEQDLKKENAELKELLSLVYKGLISYKTNPVNLAVEGTFEMEKKVFMDWLQRIKPFVK